MSDARLRELERRWRETGAVADHAAYLRERLRAGLDTQDVRLAAYCGHEAARLALGNEAPAIPQDSIGWFRGLQDLGDRAWAYGLLVASLNHAWADEAHDAAAQVVDAWLRGEAGRAELERARARLPDPPDHDVAPNEKFIVTDDTVRLALDAALQGAAQAPLRHELRAGPCGQVQRIITLRVAAVIDSPETSTPAATGAPDADAWVDEVERILEVARAHGRRGQLGCQLSCIGLAASLFAASLWWAVFRHPRWTASSFLDAAVVASGVLLLVVVAGLFVPATPGRTLTWLRRTRRGSPPG